MIDYSLLIKRFNSLTHGFKIDALHFRDNLAILSRDGIVIARMARLHFDKVICIKENKNER